MRRKNKWVVLWSAIGVSVILGILYVWSVIGKGLQNELGWTSTQASLPYTAFTVCMALGFFTAGRVQDRIGPRICVAACAVLMGAGLILCGVVTQPWPVAIGFGVICGAGVGSGNASSLTPSLKWFPSSKKGMVSGAVLAGIGFSSVLYAPFSNYLLAAIGISKSFLLFGAISFVFMYLLSLNICNPPEGYDKETGKIVSKEEAGAALSAADAGAALQKSAGENEATTKEMLKKGNFYLLFGVLALASAAGLMTIAHAAKIVQVQAGFEGGFMLVIVINLMNTAGRFVGGSISDKIGRTNTLKLMLILQALNMALFGFYSSVALITIGVLIQGFCYGSIFSVLPSLTADLYGLKNFGSNYGTVFLAWGLGGVIGPMTAARVFDTTGAYYNAYFIACALTALALLFTFLLRIKRAERAAV